MEKFSRLLLFAILSIALVTVAAVGDLSFKTINTLSANGQVYQASQYNNGVILVTEASSYSASYVYYVTPSSASQLLSFTAPSTKYEVLTNVIVNSSTAVVNTFYVPALSSQYLNETTTTVTVLSGTSVVSVTNFKGFTFAYPTSEGIVYVS
ncbi:MAG: hypothetical protein K1T65_09045, partial [Candidatus Aramenus sp.]|nr:hypothetical protein [Candidatus Aramenus sp.]